MLACLCSAGIGIRLAPLSAAEDCAIDPASLDCMMGPSGDDEMGGGVQAGDLVIPADGGPPVVAAAPAPAGAPVIPADGGPLVIPGAPAIP